MYKIAAILKKIDQGIYLLEKGVITICLIVMSILVTMDVSWRVANTEHSVMGLTIYYFLVCLFACLAYKTRLKTIGKTSSPVRILAAGVGFTAVMGIIHYFYQKIFVNGFPWSQEIALCLMLWVAFVGMSLTTKENRHVQIDSLRKLVPKKFDRQVDFLAAMINAFFCLFLTIVGYYYFEDNLLSWIQAEYMSSIFSVTSLPYWTVTMIIPISFFIAFGRFLGRGFGILINKKRDTSSVDCM